MQYPFPNFRLDDQVAVVTGGGGGIGRAVAHTFAEAGAHVLVLDTNSSAAESVARELGARGQHVVVDVTNEDDVERVMSEIARQHGRINVLFNNAGINRRSTSLDLSVDDWNAVIAVNMTGMFLCARAAARHLKASGGGTIVNTASILGLSGGWYPNIAYQATKGAVVNMTRSWAVEWAPYHIRVNAVAPSIVRTAMTNGLTSQPELVAKFEALVPLARLGEPCDMTGPVLFLASAASAFVTGHILPVDGGMMAQ
ncbi:SDR family NAD(P)-dependent oxidoreductase [Paraburkholderia aspalathi]|uniref:Gluconate 5-dehydrogenase/2-deoxy-D-gluconate 3-dehydrogenase n=1 Tax=Paraburkholderia aspalathi TaxID=1324617 RepID=A0A1I7CLL7_9BURK|nr:SDR family NAD(P)-dependent oxidoreductase [Paraburkholderia aspalathi]SFU00308.1 gluconate 5-dehydrogenase/2-deoxy-D-gluconate 3-dehydrogenase [Paraburkholderia aspalathi]